MKFTFVTIFPNLIKPYFDDSILKKALDKSYIEIDFINPRDFTKSKHLKVDDTPTSGGAGMVMTPQPLFDALTRVKSIDGKAHIVFLTPSAKRFNQKDSKRLSKKEHIVFVSGRYEGIDERVIEEWADEVLSIGDYILTGGELASLVITDSISRNIDGVLGNSISLDMESFEGELLEAPAFTKPESFNNLSVVSEYLKGNHSRIQTLKKTMSIMKTEYYRPDLIRTKYNK
jgi:tRNA (guanine37-N1)-methyltransferase